MLRDAAIKLIEWLCLPVLWQIVANHLVVALKSARLNVW